MVNHDVSEREFQLERGGQWVKGKSCETFNPAGPWLVTSDDVQVKLALARQVGDEAKHYRLIGERHCGRLRLRLRSFRDVGGLARRSKRRRG